RVGERDRRRNGAIARGYPQGRIVLALAIGTLLAVGALAFVLFPLFAGTAVATFRAPETAVQVANAAEQEAVVALREIEFDRATGKLSDSDYGELKTRYTENALAAMRGGALVSPTDDPAEAAVRAYRGRLKACGNCGPRPEPDAVFCSNCGLYLPGACGFCGGAVTEPGSSFCSSCGRQLAA
nr:zinc ribbon domain-containing protein [Gemmatimonadota bacterium]